jgi:hypothetical protein
MTLKVKETENKFMIDAQRYWHRVLAVKIKDLCKRYYSIYVLEITH